MAAGFPVDSTKRQAASILGPIEPAGKERARSSAGVTRRIGRACGVPYPSWTAATSVSSSSASALQLTGEQGGGQVLVARPALTLPRHLAFRMMQE